MGFKRSLNYKQLQSKTLSELIQPPLQLLLLPSHHTPPKANLPTNVFEKSKRDFSKYLDCGPKFSPSGLQLAIFPQDARGDSRLFDHLRSGDGPRSGPGEAEAVARDFEDCKQGGATKV